MRKIIVQELIRAGVVFALLMSGFVYLQNKGVLAASISSLLAASGGVSAVMFAVLVVVRRKTGKEFMLKRVRYLLILVLVFGVPMFIWRILQGEVTQAVLGAVGVLSVCLLLFLVRKRIGLEW
jgi:uncharacterized membrane protein